MRPTNQVRHPSLAHAILELPRAKSEETRGERGWSARGERWDDSRDEREETKRARAPSCHPNARVTWSAGLATVGATRPSLTLAGCQYETRSEKEEIKYREETRCVSNKTFAKQTPMCPSPLTLRGTFRPTGSQSTYSALTCWPSRATHGGSVSQANCKQKNSLPNVRHLLARRASCLNPGACAE